MTDTTKKLNIENFGINLKKLRTQRGITREKMAELLDVSVRIIYDWEDSLKTPKFERAVEIVLLFNVSFDSMLQLM